MLDRLFTRRSVAVLALLFAVVWFGSLDYRKLIRPDEGRYADIAHEMAVSGDWVTPRLNGLVYFEKPPLQYWATAAAFRTLGEQDWVARLWPGLTGFFGVLLAGFAGRRLFGIRAGFNSAVVLGTSLFYFAIGHLNTLDMGLSFFLELALYAYLIARSDGTTQTDARKWMLVAWSAAALAVLSKGLIALLIPAGALCLYSLATRDAAPWKHLRPMPGLLIFCAIAAPWHLIAQSRTPEFADFYFIHEHVLRFLTTTHRRAQPWWYYGPVLFAATVPWTFVAIHAVIDGWRQPGAARNTLRFLILWCAFVVIFFSISGSKLPSYILPALPALALVVGYALDRMPRILLHRHLLAIGGLALISFLLVIAAPVWFANPQALESMRAYRGWLLASSSMWFAGSLVALVLTRAPDSSRALLAAACGGLGFALLTVLGHESLSEGHSAWRLARELRDRIPADAPVFAVREYDTTLPYYLNHTLILVEYRDEMDFGLSLEPERGLPSVAEFELRWQAESRPYAVMAESTRKELESRGLPMQIVARDPRQVVVSKPDPGDS